MLCALAILALANCSKPSASAPVQEAEPVQEVKNEQAKRITLEDNKRMFENMRSHPGWDVDGELLWGYFFTDPDPKKLEAAVDPLVHAGYRFVDIHPTEDWTTYFLHVEKIEKHTPESLHLRNTEFYRFADEYGLESYDGMDVGPVSPK